MAADEAEDEYGVGDGSARGLRAGHDLDPDAWAHGDVGDLAVGLFNSVMFPSIFTLGLSGLGPLTSKGSSLMVAAIVGGALIPLAEGHLADKTGVQHAFMIPAICYVYIALFGYLGSRRAEREVGLAAAAV